MVIPLDNTILTQISKVTRENLTEKVVTQIKKLIFSKGIREGQKLPPERELTELFGVSRVVIREALKSLEQSGLIEIRKGKSGGPFVVNNQYMPLFQISCDLMKAGALTLSHFYEARIAIECSVVRLAARKATAKDITELTQINNVLMNEKADPREQGENNDAFHISLAKIVGNPLMSIMVESLLRLLRTVFTNWETVRTHDAMVHMYRRHKAIIDSIHSRNAALSEQSMMNDIEYTKQLAVSYARNNQKMLSRRRLRSDNDRFQ
ncbi:MAG: FadR family transcriptional regulator [Desulfobacteraceae bacterium]|nr:MAG: FadR family transcriptional regulator [Desulfobacteraceae bacterium]